MVKGFLDAFFRHTNEESVLTVEMETSAIFAVAEMRKVKVGAAFVISDILHEEEWDPQFHQAPVEKGLDKLLCLVLEEAPFI